MPEETLQSATKSLSEQSKKLEIASFYTHGDLEKAKQMVAGNLKDLYVIKAVFTSASINGAFIVFFNNTYGNLTDCCAITSHSFAVSDIKSPIDWKVFEKDLQANLDKGEHDQVLSFQVRDMLVQNFSQQIGVGKQAKELKKFLDQNESIALNRYMQQFIQNKVGFQNVNMSVDFETISSLDMELLSITSKKMSDQIAAAKPKEEKKAEADEDDPLKGKEVKLVLKGGLILSPVKGKEISRLALKDKIKITLLEQNQKAIQVAQAFNAYVDGVLKPISGRIVSVKKNPSGGYNLHAIVAKGIYCKIDEEEENIKVAMDDPLAAAAAQEEEPSSKKNMVIIGVLVAVLLVLIGLIIAFTR